MRFKDANKNGARFEKDFEASTIIRGVQDDLLVIQDIERFKTVPDAKPVPRAGEAKAWTKPLNHYGLDALADVVAHVRLLDFKSISRMRRR